MFAIICKYNFDGPFQLTTLALMWGTPEQNITIPTDLLSVTLGTSPMPPTIKNKSGLVKVPVHFNVY